MCGLRDFEVFSPLSCKPGKKNLNTFSTLRYSLLELALFIRLTLEAIKKVMELEKMIPMHKPNLEHEQTVPATLHLIRAGSLRIRDALAHIGRQLSS